MEFSWDERKAASNLRKHGVAFADAVVVFSDPLARIFADMDHSERERRELIVGCAAGNRLLIVSFVERDDNIRIISARQTTTRESNAHEEHIKRSRR